MLYLMVVRCGSEPSSSQRAFDVLVSSLLVVIFETVLSSPVLVGPVAFAGTVFGMCSGHLRVALCCDAMPVHILVYVF